MGILYFVYSVLLIAIILVAVIIYVLITKKYKAFGLVPIIAILLYLVDVFYNLYREQQIPVLKALSFKEITNKESDSISDHLYIFEFSSNKRLDDFSRTYKRAYLSPYIKDLDYQSISEIGDDFILYSTNIDSIKRTDKYNYTVTFDVWRKKSIDMLSSGDSLYFRLFYIEYLAPIYGTSSISIPSLKKQ